MGLLPPSRPLILGGSFNPPHHGHLITARAAAEARGFDRVVLMPCAQPPHKPDSRDLAPPADRLAMCRAAVEGDPFFLVDDWEALRHTPSYTIHTVRELKRRGLEMVNWLIGADMLNSLPTWHESACLLREANFIIMARPGSEIDWGKLPGVLQPLRNNVAATPLIEISSTNIRARVAAGQPIDYLVPPGVAEYIAERRLYREGKA
jgi:nicotinate-nucleotide adenylyltransferase